MTLISCPDCGNRVSDMAEKCLHCGRPIAVLAGEAGRTTWPAAADDAVVTAPHENPFFPVSVFKFCVMSLVSMNLYPLYWAYRNWQRIRARTGENISPFWRAFFAPLWAFSLFRRVREDAEHREVRVFWSSGLFATLYMVWTLTWRLPDPLWLTSMFAFVPVIPVVQTIAEVNESESAAEGMNAAFTWQNAMWILFGGAFVLLAVVGTFMAE